MLCIWICWILRHYLISFKAGRGDGVVNHPMAQALVHLPTIIPTREGAVDKVVQFIPRNGLTTKPKRPIELYDVKTNIRIWDCIHTLFHRWEPQWIRQWSMKVYLELRIGLVWETVHWRRSCNRPSPLQTHLRYVSDAKAIHFNYFLLYISFYAQVLFVISKH